MEFVRGNAKASQWGIGLRSLRLMLPTSHKEIWYAFALPPSSIQDSLLKASITLKEFRYLVPTTIICFVVVRHVRFFTTMCGISGMRGAWWKDEKLFRDLDSLHLHSVSTSLIHEFFHSPIVNIVWCVNEWWGSLVFDALSYQKLLCEVWLLLLQKTTVLGCKAI